MFLDLRRILTPEQFTKLRQLMEEERALKRNAP
jgi:Spy/CpxP family protein refolding chaperone